MYLEETLTLSRKGRTVLIGMVMLMMLYLASHSLVNGNVLEGLLAWVLGSAWLSSFVFWVRTKVTIDEGVLRLSVRPTPKVTFTLEDVTSAKIVPLGFMAGGSMGYQFVGPKHRLVHWGARQAVEITLTNGYVYRIGTERPEEFLAALRGQDQ